MLKNGYERIPEFVGLEARLYPGTEAPRNPSIQPRRDYHGDVDVNKPSVSKYGGIVIIVTPAPN